MNKEECAAHFLIKRLNYLLHRLEGEFFHLHPDIEENGNSTSLALTSILNEALNLHEAAFKKDKFWKEILGWGSKQEWQWEEIEIRFTYWPSLLKIKPFTIGPKNELKILGRDENNSTKHDGQLATFESVLWACAAAWFIVLEKAREAEIFLDESETNNLFKLFDCFDLISLRRGSYGVIVSRPLCSRVEYPAIRGNSEVPEAKKACDSRKKR